jgi:hypothetical protein
VLELQIYTTMPTEKNIFKSIKSSLEVN